MRIQSISSLALLLFIALMLVLGWSETSQANGQFYVHIKNGAPRIGRRNFLISSEQDLKSSEKPEMDTMKNNAVNKEINRADLMPQIADKLERNINYLKYLYLKIREQEMNAEYERMIDDAKNSKLIDLLYN